MKTRPGTPPPLSLAFPDQTNPSPEIHNILASTPRLETTFVAGSVPSRTKERGRSGVRSRPGPGGGLRVGGRGRFLRRFRAGGRGVFGLRNVSRLRRIRGWLWQSVSRLRRIGGWGDSGFSGRRLGLELRDVEGCAEHAFEGLLLLSVDDLADLLDRLLATLRQSTRASGSGLNWPVATAWRHRHDHARCAYASSPPGRIPSGSR